MAATYASVALFCAASLLVGQAVLAVCGRREWSWLAPAVGLAVLVSVCWATVRLPGEGVASAIAMAVVVVVAGGVLARVPISGGREALRSGAPVAALALLAVSLPFIVEGHFGILGTGFNPDMSQHLLAADRLSAGAESELLRQGYPLGPHAAAVALHDGLGVGLVEAFSGLTVAIAVLACLTALGALGGLSRQRQIAGALLVGLPYLVSSYLAQGAFKETAQALLVLAFAVVLLELSRSEREGPLRAVPLALIAAGSVYVYSFPALGWLAGALALWAGAELVRDRDRLRAAARPALLALVVFAVLAAPELGRMIDFREFETFDPGGPGLGNLFGQISPLEAFGIWPTGDFRVAPGDGEVPAAAFFLGAALAITLLALGLIWWIRRRTWAIPAALVAAALIYVAARADGTPYTSAKALAMISPLAMLAIVRPALELRLPAGRGRVSDPQAIWMPAAIAFFFAAAAACSVLALANAPVGPTSYSPALTDLRPLVQSGSTLALAPRQLLEDQHGVPYIAWELRGSRVCIEPAVEPSSAPPPRGIRYVITWSGRKPFAGLKRVPGAGYHLWQRTVPVPAPGPCPLIAVREARQGHG